MEENTMKRSRLCMALVTAGLLLMGARAHASDHIRFKLTPASDAMAACLPNAQARVLILEKEDERGVDTLDLKAKGLPPNTDFAVFLTELPVAPFGAVQYIGDFTTNADGRGSVRVDAIIDEAFSSSVDANNNRSHTNLNHVVFWFADPAAD